MSIIRNYKIKSNQDGLELGITVVVPETKVKGIIRNTEANKNGIFIELKPNLVGMAEYQEGIEYGKQVDVFIKKIIPEKKKIKLIIC